MGVARQTPATTYPSYTKESMVAMLHGAKWEIIGWRIPRPDDLYLSRGIHVCGAGWGDEAQRDLTERRLIISERRSQHGSRVWSTTNAT